jgi:hypothetical protein
LLIDEVHLGKIVVGKRRKLVGADAIVYKPKDEWIVYNNCHEAVKTQLEHDKILFIMQRDKTTPKAARAGTNAFSGLIRCAKCGHVMQIQKRSDRPNDQLKSCVHRDPFGDRCPNLGGSILDIYEGVRGAILAKEKELLDAIRNGIQLEDIRVMLDLAEKKLAEVKKFEKRLSKLEDMRLDEEIDKDRYMIRQAEIQTSITNQRKTTK